MQSSLSSGVFSETEHDGLFHLRFMRGNQRDEAGEHYSQHDQ